VHDERQRFADEILVETATARQEHQTDYVTPGPVHKSKRRFVPQLSRGSV